ncbi:MAG: DEAD/DEAH box helicase, partial [Synergistaceae bacterium]|nr:DEAD/DEAH box helicase [Synergistaceae bacterium]
MCLPGVGPKRLRALSSLGIESVLDLLFHLPYRYEDRRRVTPIASLSEDHPSVVRAEITSCEVRATRTRNVYVAELEIADGQANAEVILFGGQRSFTGFAVGRELMIYGEPSLAGSRFEFRNPDWALGGNSGRPGFPADWLGISPIYPTVSGLPRKQLAVIIKSCVTSGNLKLFDPLPSEILKKYSFPSLLDAFKGVHTPKSFEEIPISRRRLAYQEFFELQTKIFEARLRRASRKSVPLADGEEFASRFVESLPFSLSESQRAAFDEISGDLRETRPMYRLLQGDVGAGKTAVAASAIAQCAGAGFQSAVLVPTTVLSGQFYRQCVGFLSPHGVRCAELTGGVTGRRREETLSSLKRGETDVIVGTHALLSSDVEFKALGLLVIDEQHRFGVRQRELMENRGEHAPHVLMMSATPIPRTLCMALYGDVDATVITGRPGRKPVITKIASDNHIGELYGFLAERAKKGERVYWVCPSIDDEDDASVMKRASDMEKKIRGVAIERLHGRMAKDEKNASMARFAAGE